MTASKTEIEKAYETIAKAEKKMIEDALAELAKLREKVEDPLKKIIDGIPRIPGQPSAALSRLNDYRSQIIGWPEQIRSMESNLQQMLSRYDPPPEPPVP